MKFLSFKHFDEKKFGILAKNGKIFDLSKTEKNLLNFIIKDKNLKDFEDVIGTIELDQVEILAPISKPKQDVICLGINFLDHAKESYKFKGKEFDGKREDAVYFGKRVEKFVNPNSKIPSYEEITKSLDYEGELAIILKKDAKNVSLDEAKDYIFGYTILNDISARDVQNRHKQWYLGKSLQKSAPLGPILITPDEFNSKNETIKTLINGEIRQEAKLCDMIFDESYVICEISKYFTIKAGSVISLGTPSGVGFSFNPPKFLKSGDKIECIISNLGNLTNFIK